MRFVTLVAFVGLTAAAVAQAPPSPLHLIPMPNEVTFKADLPVTGVTIECPNCGSEDQFAADDLRDTLASRGVPAGHGLRIVLQRLGQHPDASFTDAMRPEGYTVSYADGTLTLTGATASGVFYAAQTAKQMIERQLNGSFVLHAADIRDSPAMKYRGLSDDLSRGPVDTLAFQEKIVRTLAAYKDNLYSPYFENTQQYASNPLPAPPGGSISAADARALVAYAAKYHVMVVPDQEAFGHLRHMLVYEEYQPLAETPHGAVLAPGQPGSLQVINQMFTELAALYPSPFLHIGADETFDLGVGQTKAAVESQGLGPVYLNFMQQIDTTLRPLNRRLLFWGDIAEKSPDLLKAIPDSFKRDMIAISWHYSPSTTGFTKYLDYFKSAGFETWVAPGINNWSRVYPNYNMGLENIQEFTRDGQAMGADGQLNTIWYDDGEALAANNWYGILFGCAAAWQQGESSIPQFQANFGPVFHDDMTGKLNLAQQELMAAHDVLKYDAQVGDGSDGLFWIDPWSKDGQQYAQKIRPYTHELRLHAERALDLIAQARAAYPAAASTPIAYSPTNKLPSNPTSLRETNAIDALELGARRFDFIGLKFQLADEMAEGYARAQADALSTDRKTHSQVNRELSDINGVNGRIQDIKDGYSLLRDLYSQLWLRTNRPYALRPVLEHYDSTIGLWLTRIDKVRSAQRQWADSRILPNAADFDIPAPPPVPASVSSPVPSPAPPAVSSPAPATPPKK
ncbi:MAG TPA: family 20 glycosylhydrolase [Acidobacteriaceae bacterium]